MLEVMCLLESSASLEHQVKLCTTPGLSPAFFCIYATHVNIGLLIQILPHFLALLFLLLIIIITSTQSFLLAPPTTLPQYLYHDIYI